MKPSLAQRAKRDPALLRKALADPSLRSKQPSSMLSAAQRRSRNQNEANRALGDVTHPLTGDAMINAAKSLVGGQYQPQFSELDRQSAQTTAQGAQAQARTKSIYADLAKYQSAALGAQQTGQATTAAGVAGATQGALDHLTAAQAQSREQAAQDAAVRGTGLDGGAAAELAAQSLAAKQSATDRGQIASNGQQANAQTANAVLGGIGASTQQRGAEHQNDIDTATRSTLQTLAGKRADVAAQKGASLTDTLIKLRQQGSDAYLTGVGLGVKEATAAQSSADRRAAIQGANDRSAASIKGANDRSAASIKAANDRARLKAKGKGKKATPTQQGEAQDSITSAASIVQAYKKSGADANTVRQVLLRGQAADKTKGQDAIKPVKALYAQAAIELSYPPYKLSKATKDALHARKINIGDLGLDQLVPQVPGVNLPASLTGG